MNSGDSMHPNDLERVTPLQLQKARDLETKIYKTRINYFVIEHGSFRAAGRALQIDHAYLHRLANGIKRNPSDQILKKLDLI